MDCESYLSINLNLPAKNGYENWFFSNISELTGYRAGVSGKFLHNLQASV